MPSQRRPRKIETRSDKLEIPPLAEPRKASILLVLISVVGLIISLASGFQENIPFLKSLCSSSCRDTLEIHFLRMPFWVWGAAFYAVAALLSIFKRDMVVWLASPAAGVEAVLILLMIQLKAPCVFCMANVAIIVLLLAASSRKELFWQETTVALVLFLGFFFWVPLENSISPSSAKSAAGHPTGSPGGTESGIAATVGDEVITNQRLDVLLGQKLLETRRDIYRMKREKLDQLIVEVVLEKEAKQQGKTIDALIDQIAPLGSSQVEESEIDKYMQDNHEQLQMYQGNIPDLRLRVKAFLEQQKRSQAIKAYAHSLETRYGVRVLLPLPNPPKVKISTQGAPALGPADAPVTVVEFSDYQCPACRSTHEVVKQVMAMYGDKVQWIYKDYPLRRHQDAFRAAEASHCAEDQGKFWEYQERLFTSTDLSPAGLINIAVQLGMSQDKFSQCLQESKYKILVEKNIRDAVEAGLDRTPTFMINGTLFVGGPTVEALKGMIDEELNKAAQKPQTVGKAQ